MCFLRSIHRFSGLIAGRLQVMLLYKNVGEICLQARRHIKKSLQLKSNQSIFLLTKGCPTGEVDLWLEKRGKLRAWRSSDGH